MTFSFYRFPRAQVPRRLPLNYAKGEQLEKLLDPYLRASLQKGVPPLFTDIRPLYNDSERVQIIEKLMNRYLKNLEETGHLCETGKNIFCFGFILMVTFSFSFVL